MFLFSFLRRCLSSLVSTVSSSFSSLSTDFNSSFSGDINKLKYLSRPILHGKHIRVYGSSVVFTGEVTVYLCLALSHYISDTRKTTLMRINDISIETSFDISNIYVFDDISDLSFDIQSFGVHEGVNELLSSTSSLIESGLRSTNLGDGTNLGFATIDLLRGSVFINPDDVSGNKVLVIELTTENGGEILPMIDLDVFYID